MSKKILVYFGNQQIKQPFVERVLQDLKIPYQILSDEDLLQRCGYLMELDGFDMHSYPQDIPHFESDLMILKNIEDQEIMAINSLLNAMDISMQRKAMLTEHNAHWQIADLLVEIEKEHQYFQHVESIRTILSESSQLIIEHYTTSSWKSYEQAFYKAYECISKDCTPEEVEEAYLQLIRAKTALQSK